jgi:hypothetical protein
VYFSFENLYYHLGCGWGGTSHYVQGVDLMNQQGWQPTLSYKLSAAYSSTCVFHLPLPRNSLPLAQSLLRILITANIILVDCFKYYLELLRGEPVVFKSSEDAQLRTEFWLSHVQAAQSQGRSDVLCCQILN